MRSGRLVFMGFLAVAGGLWTGFPSCATSSLSARLTTGQFPMCWSTTVGWLRIDDFRSLCGYGDRVPSRSVFRDTAAALARNWSRFQECTLSPEASDELTDLVLRGYEDEGKNPFPSHENIFTPKLPELGWNGNLPPHYRPDFGGSWVPRRAGSSKDEILGGLFRCNFC